MRAYKDLTEVDLTEAELLEHETRLDRLQVDLFGHSFSLRPILVFLVVVPPALFGWEVGIPGDGGASLRGPLGAAALVTVAVAFAETIGNTRILPRSLLPRRRRLERRWRDLRLDRVLLTRHIAGANRSLAVTGGDFPERRALEAKVSFWREKLGEVNRDLDELEAELGARYEDWRRFLAEEASDSGGRRYGHGR